MDDKNSSTSGATEATAPSARTHSADDGGAVAVRDADGVTAADAIDVLGWRQVRITHWGASGSLGFDATRMVRHGARARCPAFGTP